METNLDERIEWAESLKYDKSNFWESVKFCQESLDLLSVKSQLKVFNLTGDFTGDDLSEIFTVLPEAMNEISMP
jgi:hypothetical protein